MAKVWVEEMPWRRISIAGKAHDHGFVMGGSEVHTVFVTVDSNRKTEVPTRPRSSKSHPLQVCVGTPLTVLAPRKARGTPSNLWR